MQHRYVPDLGDFSKFAVIDALSAHGAMRTALVWYLADPDELGESHRNDGKHTTYLEDDRQQLEACNPVLYARFRRVFRSGVKHVGQYERLAVAPNVSYFDEPLSYTGVAPAQRAAYRAGWLSRAVEACAPSEIVFLDPDNGLAGETLSLGRKHAVKYATMRECAAFTGDGRRTLVVYQHAHRQGKAPDQARAALDRLCVRLGTPRGSAFALRFHRGTTRFYLVLPAAEHARVMRDRAEAMAASRWGLAGHFSLIR